MFLDKKVDDRLCKIFNNIGDPFIKNVYIDDQIQSKLLPYQIFHVCNMLTALDLNKVILDCSDTGTGKTYTAIASILQKKYIPFIVCPKSAIITWMNVCKYFNCTYHTIINYESLSSKYPNWPDIGTKDNRIIFVFDEVHKCKNTKTINGINLMKTKFLSNKKILISATLVDKINDFTIFGYMLDFYNNIKKGKAFIRNIKDEFDNSISRSNPLKDKIFPYKGSKMSIKEIKDFPTQKIILRKLESKINTIDISTLTDVIKIRQELENQKMDDFYNLTIDYLDNDISVVIFVNFINNMKKLSTLLKSNRIKHHLLYSDISDKDRNTFVDDFQENRINVIICTYGTGGASISLHDLYGRQRASIISLPESGIAFSQALGRIVRAGSKSVAMQTIPIYNKTYERTMYLRIKEKIDNLNKVCDPNSFELEF